MERYLRNRVDLGGEHTLTEIVQQPQLWKDVLQYLTSRQQEITAFLQKVRNEHTSKNNSEYNIVRVLFTGAGTSAFIGNTVSAYLRNIHDVQFIYESIATTDIVTSPFESTLPLLVVSFARSGNSPESAGAVTLLTQLNKHIFHIIITCNKSGALSKLADKTSNTLVLTLSCAHDKGFAMTGSFTSMMLSALYLFAPHITDYIHDHLTQITSVTKSIFHMPHIPRIAKKSFDRIVYLGSGVFHPLAQEASLKFLELSAGKIASFHDSVLGFRHGPKSILNARTLLMVFVSSHPYTQKYDLHFLKEIYKETDRPYIVAITTSPKVSKYCDDAIVLPSISSKKEATDDIVWCLPYIVIAQCLAVCKSIKLRIHPDNPSPSGKVNRVVKGVRIYDYSYKDNGYSNQ